MKVAQAYGAMLPTYESAEEATEALFRYRDSALEYLAAHYPGVLDYSPESLKTLEAWYFSHFEHGQERSGDLSRARIEESLGTYFAAALIRADSRYSWAVEPFPFTPDTYVLAAARPLMQVNVTRRTNLYAHSRNVRRQSLYREFKRYAG